MAYYAYKQVRDLLPQHIIDKQGPDYEGDGNYDGDQWNAAADYIVELKEALAAKDARIAELETTVQRLSQFMTNLDPTCSDAVAADMWAALDGEWLYQQMPGWDPEQPDVRPASAEQDLARKPLPRPDTARLDKLPACFHMLRTCPGTKPGSPWWYSYETNTEYETLRDAIDAHTGAE